jgi:hypothetical protein
MEQKTRYTRTFAFSALSVTGVSVLSEETTHSEKLHIYLCDIMHKYTRKSTIKKL